MELKKKLLGLLAVLGLLAALMLSVNLIGNALFPSPDAKTEKLAEKLSELESELQQMEKMSETKGWCGFYGKRYEEILIQWIFGSGRLYEEYNSKVSEWNELAEELAKLRHLPESEWWRVGEKTYIYDDCTPNKNEYYDPNPNKKRGNYPPPHRGADPWLY